MQEGYGEEGYGQEGYGQQGWEQEGSKGNQTPGYKRAQQEMQYKALEAHDC